MSQNSLHIQTDAAKALAEWKALFAAEVTQHAKTLAKNCDKPGVITLAHYQAAAQSALKSLAAAIQDSSSHDGDQEAA